MAIRRLLGSICLSGLYGDGGDGVEDNFWEGVIDIDHRTGTHSNYPVEPIS